MADGDRDPTEPGAEGAGDPTRDPPAGDVSDPARDDAAAAEERAARRERAAEGRDVRREETARREEAAHHDQAATGRRDALIWRVVQAVDYLFFLLYSLFLIRFVLGLLGASEEAGFVQLIHGLTDPFYAPFEGIVTRPALDGGYLDFPLALALIAYVVLHLAVRGLIRVIVGPRPPAV